MKRTLTPLQRKRFDELLDAASRSYFVYGEWDCASLAIKAYEAVTEKPSPVAITWTDEAEANAALVGMGGLHAAFTSALGEASPVADCVRGDILFADIEGTVAVGVHDGARMLAIAGPGIRGLMRVPWPLVVCGWRIV